jgi:hypothetical protein
MMSALGSMSMPATVRGAIHLLSMGEDEAKRYGWPPEKALQVVKQIEAKNSNAKKGAAGAMFYEWRSVSITAEDPSDPNTAATFGTEDMGVLVPITSPAMRQVTAAETLTALQQAQGAGKSVVAEVVGARASTTRTRSWRTISACPETRQKPPSSI